MDLSERRKERGLAVLRAPSSPEGGSSEVRSYEELDGAVGRAILFRPRRFGASDLEPLHGSVTVEMAGRECESSLRDVSQGGVAFPWCASASVALGQMLPLVLRFDDQEFYRGRVRVSSVREQEGATLVGVSFDQFLLDIDAVMQLREVRRWEAENGGPLLQRSTWRGGENETFESLVATLRLFLEDAERQLGHLESRLPWHVLHGADSPARRALIACLRRDFVSDAIQLGERIDSALRLLPEGHRNEAAKEWSLRHVQPFLMQAPVLHRARYKPFGYPGDYEVMNFIYERNFEGATLFARAVGLAFGTEMRAAVAVRTRKDVIKRELEALLRQRAGSARPVRVLSIAAGPAQELFEVFGELSEMPVPLEVVLFEQDENALSHAWRRLVPLARGRFGGAVQLTFLHDSIKRLLRDGQLFAPFEAFDLVYSCGLYDYLQKSTAVGLTRRLAAATAPGGRLLVANMVDHPSRWLMEHHLEWPLVYRTREELLEMGRKAAPGARLRIIEEASGANPFLEMSRGEGAN